MADIDASTAAAMRAKCCGMVLRGGHPDPAEVVDALDELQARAEQAEARAEQWHKAAQGQWELADSVAMRELRAENAALTARVKMLEWALTAIAVEVSVPVHTWKNGINFKKLYEQWRKIATTRIDVARAALSREGGE